MQKSNSKPAVAKPAIKHIVVPAAPSAQQKSFDAAMTAFHMRDFAKAKQQFDSAVDGPTKEITYAAKQHSLMCQQRMAKSNLKLDNAEDLYNYGVSQMNKRDLEGAQQSLEKALKYDELDHIHYALALVLGLRNDIAGSAKHLRRAIEIHPKNRVAAHNDPDFAELMQYAPIKELLASAT